MKKTICRSPGLSYRREESISEWVYPAPPEPVDWKTRCESHIAIYDAYTCPHSLCAAHCFIESIHRFINERALNKTTRFDLYISSWRRSGWRGAVNLFNM